MKVNWTRYISIALVLLGAVGLKLWYSTANVNELRWILAPTVLFVELISGSRFRFEPYAGYINGEHTLVIAPACAGVNFMIIAFLVLTLGHFLRKRSDGIGWRFMIGAVLGAYGTTIAANTVRISAAVWMQPGVVQSGLADPAQVHRIEGIVIYFGFLLLLFIASEMLDGRHRPEGINIRKLMGRCVVPLAIYYGTTLGIPLMNAANRSREDFWEYSLVVLAIPAVLVGAVAACLHLARLCQVYRKQIELTRSDVSQDDSITCF